jgi:microsomal dipeptidase-like Zn-dependent dipeptidase
VLQLASKPLMVSHTGLKSWLDSSRTLSDEMVRLVAVGGGVFGIGLWPKVRSTVWPILVFLPSRIRVVFSISENQSRERGAPELAQPCAVDSCWQVQPSQSIQAIMETVVEAVAVGGAAAVSIGSDSHGWCSRSQGFAYPVHSYIYLLMKCTGRCMNYFNTHG